MHVCLRSCSWSDWSMSVWGYHSSTIINDVSNWWLFKHNLVCIAFDMLKPGLHPFSKLFIVLRGFLKGWNHLSIQQACGMDMLPVYHIANIHTDKHIHTYRQFGVSSEPNLHVFWCVGGICSPLWTCTQTWNEHSNSTQKGSCFLYIVQCIKDLFLSIQYHNITLITTKFPYTDNTSV